jgi:cytochrome oxidase assembly protein ShyY1
MSYALQWFGFAALLLAGYPFYVRKRERTRSA